MANVTMDPANAPYMERVREQPLGTVESKTVVVDKRRISWPAVLAGVVIAIVVQIALNMLGLSIGANTINPISEANPVEPSLGTAAIIWMAGSMLLSLFAGGYVASHLSGTVDNANGMFHGLVAWGVVALITFFLLTSTAGGIVSGVVGAVSQGASLLAQGAVAAVPEVAERVNLSALTQNTIGQELSGLRSAFQAQNQPEGATTDGTTANAGAPASSDQLAQFATLEDLELNTRVMNFLTGDQSDATARQEVVTLLTERTGLTEEEINTRLDGWVQAFNTVRDDAEETAREVGQALTDTLAAVAGALFVALLTGAFAAGVGGWVGTYDHMIVRTATVTRSSSTIRS